MNTISTKIKQMPDFVCKTPSIRHDPVIGHDPYQPLITLYLLRLALGLKNKLPSFAIEDWFEDKLGELTGLATGKTKIRTDADKDESTNCDSSYKASRSRSVASLYRKIDNRLNQLLTEGMPLNAALFTNINWLATELNLSVCDQEILVLTLLMASNRKFNTYISLYCEQSQDISVLDYLHIMTTRPIVELKKCLDPAGTLCRIGWLDATEKLDVSCLVVPPTLLCVLLNKYTSPQELRELLFKPVKPTVIQANAYPLLLRDLDVLIPYLQTVLERKQSGINVLIFGASSSSKWELPRVLAKSIGAQLYQVAEVSPNGHPLEPQDRFAACQFTQEWLIRHKSSSLIVIDGAGDVLPHRPISLFLDEEVANTGIDLALMKRQMADNPVPIIWIIDKPKTIDSACLRLFNFALEVDKMPEALRHKRIAKATHSLSVSEAWQQQMTKRSDIPLNQIEKAAAIAELNQSKIGLSAEQIMEQVLNSHSRLFNRPEAIKHHRPETGYDLRFTNTSISLGNLLNGLQRNPHGTLCLFGASGTGKTAFARHLAEQLGLPLLIKRASDLLDKYVGENEKNLSKMFKEAKRDGAILLLDEADSFLTDRRELRHSFEISKINELLTQMEQYEGIFICTTNLMERVDSAALRRFDFKVKFDYLSAEQRWALFQQESQSLGAKLPEDEQSLIAVKQQVQRLTQITPGDFAVLSRQARFQIEPLELANLISVLEQECLAKGEQFGNKIGFMQ